MPDDPTIAMLIFFSIIAALRKWVRVVCSPTSVIIPLTDASKRQPSVERNSGLVLTHVTHPFPIHDPCRNECSGWRKPHRPDVNVSHRFLPSFHLKMAQQLRLLHAAAHSFTLLMVARTACPSTSREAVSRRQVFPPHSSAIPLLTAAKTNCRVPRKTLVQRVGPLTFLHASHARMHAETSQF